ncbi:hypothetical protein [Massilia sp. TN1-12]|uniref:hypothetical protein n=1 Tax=Massilia paldalensis TaxID=3377675 RepID=UPI00384CFE14
MVSWLRNLTYTGIAVGASWSGAVWRWRATNRMPDTADIVLWLLVLPLAVLLAAWGGRALYRRATAAPAAAASAPEAAAAAAPVPAPALPPLAIVASALRVPHGGSASELAAALASGEARPQLDTELVDDYGYPVLAARVDGVDVDAARAAMGPSGAAAGFGDEHWRAVALGGAVAAELADWLAAHPRIPEHAARIDARAPSPLPLLELHVAWPQDFTAAQRTAGGAWYRDLLAASGWPAERIAIAPEPDHGDTNGLPPSLLARAGQPLVAVVLACGSQLGSATVDAMAVAGKLLTARQPQGLIPGEGACALLLADATQAALLAPHEELPALRALAAGRLGASADDARRVDASELETLCARALRDAGCAADAVALVVADADARAGRVMELMGVATAQLPQLDTAADLLRAGSATGACAPVAWLSALAVGAEGARERRAPVLCIGNLDPFRRDVAVVAPADFMR